MKKSEIGNIHPYRDVPPEGRFTLSVMNLIVLPILFTLKLSFAALVCYSGFFLVRDLIWRYEYDEKKESQHLVECQQNLQTMAQSLEEHHAVHGQYPQNQYQLIPNFLNKVPICPASERDGYRTNFAQSDQGLPTYTVVCADNQHHRLATPTHPNIKGPRL